MTVYRTAKISELTADSSLSGTETFVVAQGGQNYKVTLDQLLTFVEGNADSFTQNVTFTQNVAVEGDADIADLDARFVRLAGTSLRVLVDGDVAGWTEGAYGDGDYKLEPSSNARSLHLNETSLAGTTGGLFLGRTTVRIPVKQIASAGTETAKGGSNFGASSSGTWAGALVEIDRSGADVTVTIQDNNGDEEDWKKGDHFTIVQAGTGQITVAVEAGTLYKPATCNAKTSEQHAMVTVTCIDATAGAPVWRLSGDMEVA